MVLSSSGTCFIKLNLCLPMFFLQDLWYAEGFFFSVFFFVFVFAGNSLNWIVSWSMFSDNFQVKISGSNTWTPLSPICLLFYWIPRNYKTSTEYWRGEDWGVKGLMWRWWDHHLSWECPPTRGLHIWGPLWPTFDYGTLLIPWYGTRPNVTPIKPLFTTGLNLRKKFTVKMPLKFKVIKSRAIIIGWGWF